MLKLNKIKEIGKTIDRENLVYKTNEYTYSFNNFRAINTFGRDIYNGTITLKKPDKDQNTLLVKIMNFKSKRKPQIQRKNKRKNIFKDYYE